MRARLVSAVAFGGAAALGIAVLVGVAAILGPASPGPMTARLYWVPPALVGSAALAGALAGPRVLAAAGAGRAAVLGVGVTLAAAAVYVLGASAGIYAADIAAGRPGDTGDLLSAELWGITLVAALALSPLGAGAAVAAWRWGRRTTGGPA